MSHITEISVAGLAGRDEVYRQKLNRDVNVFFGLNGSGKTSLLKIMHSAMTGDASLLQSVPFKRAEVKFYSVKYDRVYTRRVVKTKPNDSNQSKNTDESDVQAAFEEERPTIEHPKVELHWNTSPELPSGAPTAYAHTYLPTSRLYLGPDPYYYGSINFAGTHDSVSSEEALDIYFARSLERLWTSYSADVLSKVNKAQQDGLASILKAVLTTKQPKIKESQKISPEMAFERVATFLHRQGSPRILGSLAEFKERYKEDAKLRSVVSDINEVEQGIERAMAPRNKLQTLIQDMFDETKIVFRDQNIEVNSTLKCNFELGG